MKKLLCILLSTILMFTMFSFTLSAGAEESPTNANASVAVMYLCVSGAHLPYIFGHTWICIRNISNENISVGSQTVAPGAMISAGLHSFRGMVFNREMSEYRGSTVDAIEKYLTKSELETVSNEIMSSNWSYYELFAHNCTHFVSAVWRSVTGRSIRTFIFPAVLKNQFSSSEMVRVYIG